MLTTEQTEPEGPVNDGLCPSCSAEGYTVENDTATHKPECSLARVQAKAQGIATGVPGGAPEAPAEEPAPEQPAEEAQPEADPES